MGQVLTKLVSLFVMVCLARYLGQVGFGKFSFAFAYLGFFAILTDFGLDQILIREIASVERPPEVLFGNAVLLKLTLALLSLILACSIALSLDYPLSTKMLVLLASISLIFSYQSPSFGNVFTTIFTVNLSRVYVTAIDLVSKVVMGALTLLFILLRRTLFEIVAVNVFGLIPGFIALVYLSNRFIRPKFSLDFGLWKFLLRESLPIALSSIFVMVYFRVDVILLSLWKGEGAIGLYSASFKLTEAFTILGSAFIITLLPLASRYYKSARKSMEMAYQVSLKYLLLLMIPVSIGTLFYRHQIINILYGGEYAATSSALSILIWATTFMMLNMTITTFLISIYQQKIFTLMAFCLMVANLTFNFSLIPRFSFVGAAIATVLTEGLFTVFGAFYLARFHDLLPSSSLLRLIPVNLVFILFLVFFSKYSIFAIVPVSIPLYLALLTIFGGVGRFEVDLLKKVFARA